MSSCHQSSGRGNNQRKESEMGLLAKEFRPGTGYNVDGVTFYHTYRFRAEEQDPIVDKMQTIMEDEMGSIAKGRFGKIKELSGLSESTLHSWFVKRKTRRPQYA